MQRLELKLVAIRTMEVDRIAEFYGCLGLRFAYGGKNRGHRFRAAGFSPQRLVVEIHAVNCPEEVDRTTRLGFAVPDFQATMKSLAAFEAEFIEEPRPGQRALVRDPDGRVIDLYERRTPLGSAVRFLRRLCRPWGRLQPS